MHMPGFVQARIDWLLNRRRVVTIRAVFALYDTAGGGLVASGLAFTALFAVLAAILFLIGLTGYVVQEPKRMAAIVEEIGRRIPPLEGLVRTGLQRVAESSTSFSVIGLLSLAWGVSRFYGSLDDAIARLYREVPPRGLFGRIAGGFVLVGLLIGALLLAAGLAALGTVAEGVVGGSPVAVVGLWTASQAIGLLLHVLAIAAILVFVPPHRPRWQSIALPAVVVGVAILVLTNVFVLVEARLVGALELFSGFAFVLATMLWLSFGFQLLLLGAAWSHVREFGVEAVEAAQARPVAGLPPSAG